MAPWCPVNSEAELTTAVGEVGTPSILKTSRFGYDGKGQVKITHLDDSVKAWDSLSSGNVNSSESAFAILESMVDFVCEISVIAARDHEGKIVCFEPAENVHANHMLATSTVPARIDARIAQDAEKIASRAISGLDLIGLLAVEMFVTKNGEIICNEMAPRPHNSGHWTMDACDTDQFQQLVRAATGLPLLAPRRHSDVKMINLVGEDVQNLEAYVTDPAAQLHLYGKAEARPGRKMGHVNLLSSISS